MAEMTITQPHVPPQNLEAEEAVLGAMMVSAVSLEPVFADVRLEPEDFYRERHRVVFRAIRELYERDEPIDAITVSELLGQHGALDEVGGRDAVSLLASSTPAPGNAGHYAQIVKQNALLRRLLGAAQQIQQSIHGREGEPRELVERAEQMLFRVAHEEHTSDFHNVAEILVEELARLEELSKGDASVTGTPSGFRDLDAKTGGFQPGNLIVIAARPAMGKCLGGRTLVHDPLTGRRRRLDEIVESVERGEEAWVASVGPGFKLFAARVSAVARSGRKRLARLTTRLGRSIEATSNHPFLTLKGWKALEELEPGDRIAVPRVLPRTRPTSRMADPELVLLAALIADGSLTRRTPAFCYGPNSPVLPEVRRAAASLGLRLVDSGGHGNASISAGRGAPRNIARELCEEHGIWGKHSGEKFVPDTIFELSDEQIARFLSILYGCDGHIYAGRCFRQIGYTTISERLAHDVQQLLLRLGIVATIRTLRRPVYEGTATTAREVRITGREGLFAFCHRVGACGKEAQANAVLQGLAAAPTMTNVDTIPVEVWERINTARGSRTWRELSVATGRPLSHNWHVNTRGLSRPLLGQIAGWAGDREFRDLANSDVWWDEVKSIVPAGVEDTYDVAVPGLHNFVADDLIVHNSSLVSNIAENVASKHGRPVAFFSLEMSQTELAHRFIACRARIPSDKLRRGQVAAKDWPGVLRACNELEKAPLWLDDSSDLGLLDLRAKARRLHAQEKGNGNNGLGLVIVDYIQLMRANDPSNSRVEQVSQLSRGLKILARELHVPVLAISQLSRAPEQRPDKRPILSDLRESGQIEADADLVAFIYRDEYYNPDDTTDPGGAELILAKHRNGPTGSVRMVFLERYPRFADRAREERPIEQRPGEGPPLADAVADE